MIDSTGLSIHGEGRWTRHKHGKRERRGWRKLHIGVSDGLIVASHLTDERVPDGSIAPNLIKQAGSINALTADKAYDQIDVYQAAIDRGSTDLKLLIHPRTDAVISASDQAALRQRDVHVKSIKEDGVLAWRRTSGYYHQSAVENMFFRYKTLLGDQLRARGEASQQVESVLACTILNHFRSLGRPRCELVT